MSKQFYAGYVLPYHSVLSDNLLQTMSRTEEQQVSFFTSPADAFRYIQLAASAKALPATVTPLGNDYFKMRGVGVLYRVELSDEQIQQLKEPTDYDKFRGIKMVGPLVNVKPLELQFVLSEDDFCPKSIELASPSDIRAKVSERLESFERMERILENTLPHIRESQSIHTLHPESLYMTCGPQAPARNGFKTESPQDQKFWDIHKMLTENNAGIQYIAEMKSLYNKYRDVYACGIVNGREMETASTQAAAAVFSRLEDIAEQTGDSRMEELFKDASERAALEVLQFMNEDMIRNN